MISQFATIISQLSNQPAEKGQIAVLEAHKDVVQNPLVSTTIKTCFSSINKGVSSAALKDLVEANDCVRDTETYEALLAVFADESLSPTAKKKAVKELASADAVVSFDQHKILSCVLDGTFQCGCGSSVFGQFVDLTEADTPTWNAIMAQDYSKEGVKLQALVSDGKDWALQPKLDGFRCVMFIEDGKYKEAWVPRNMKRIDNKVLTNLVAVVNNMQWPSGIVVLDGELGTQTDNPRDMFATIGEFRRKDHIVEKPLYVVFDMLIGGFDCKKLYIDRYNDATKYVGVHEAIQTILCEPLARNVKAAQIVEFAAQYVAAGYEGAIVRCLDDAYIQKRTPRLGKIKPFFDHEFVVQSIEIGEKFFSSLGKTTKCVSSLAVKGVYDGKEVVTMVGSGLTEQERLDWHAHPAMIEGKTVTIKFQDVIKSENSSTYALRFPVFKSIRTL